MKQKPNKPRPESQTHTEPGGGATEPGGSAFGAGSEQEPGASGTSGQSVPKSKFRQKSQQEQAAASKLRMEKRGEKREAAREKLAKQKPPKQKGPIRKAAGAAGWGVHGFVHGKPGASGKGGQPGRGQVSESGGGLSFPHRRTGAPGAFQKLFYPVLAETAA